MRAHRASKQIAFRVLTFIQQDLNTLQIVATQVDASRPTPSTHVVFEYVGTRKDIALAFWRGLKRLFTGLDKETLERMQNERWGFDSNQMTLLDQTVRQLQD